MCRQFVSVVESFQISKRSSSIFFPIEIGHYRCPSLKEAILSAKSLTRLCFKPFIPRLDFDYTGFVRNNVKNAVSLVHSPQLKDFWANCLNEFEVRKRLWSCLTIKKIIVFNVELDTYGLKDDDFEEVLDQFYMDQIEYMPIPEIDWEKREENDVYARTKDVIARTAKWIKLKAVATPNIFEES